MRVADPGRDGRGGDHVERDGTTGRTLSRWSAAELARDAVARGIVCQVSGATVWRWLSEDAIRPWAWRAWVFPRDPDFRAKAGVVLDLSERRREGRRLQPGDDVISADEQTRLQALLRRHALIAPGPGRRGLVERDCRRRGTLADLAAVEVHDPSRGLFGRCEPKSWPNLVLVRLPGHASWLNQIEISFSLLARTALTPCHFTSLNELAERVLGVQAEFATTATPFDWTCARRDLHALLDRRDHCGRLTPTRLNERP